ncbi:hypothetical protein [Sphingomonas sp.]|uniref:hypothetical protein n=1 Tax=Sphingomonas sp. TaxID=28214 RepID=UPI0031D4428D
MAPGDLDHVRLFQRALRDNVTMDEARRRVVNERWKAVTPRRRASPSEPDASEEPRPNFWWQRD